MKKPPALTNFDPHIQQGHMKTSSHTIEEWNALNHELCTLQSDLLILFNKYSTQTQIINKVSETMTRINKKATAIEQRMQIIMTMFNTNIQPTMNLTDEEKEIWEEIKCGKITEERFLDPGFEKTFKRILKKANISIN